MNRANVTTGINIQWPISELILSGQKTIETRFYPLPSKYLDTKLLIVETPGAKGKFKSRIVGYIVFGMNFQYKSKAQFDRDVIHHCVSSDSKWYWIAGKKKWAWPIKKVVKFKKPTTLQRRPGIKFTTGLAHTELLS